MKLRTRIIVGAASALLMGFTSLSAMAQPYGGPPPRGPQHLRPGPQRRPPPRPYYHNYNGGYYAAPVYAPPPVVYAPPVSPGISLVIPFHF